MPTPAWALTKSADEAGARFFFRHRPDNPGAGKEQLPERLEHDRRLSFRKIGASFSGGGVGHENRRIPADLRFRSGQMRNKKSRGRDAAPRELDADLRIAVMPQGGESSFLSECTVPCPARDWGRSGSRVHSFTERSTHRNSSRRSGRRDFPERAWKNCVRSDNDAWSVVKASGFRYAETACFQVSAAVRAVKRDRPVSFKVVSYDRHQSM